MHQLYGWVLHFKEEKYSLFLRSQSWLTFLLFLPDARAHTPARAHTESWSFCCDIYQGEVRLLVSSFSSLSPLSIFPPDYAVMFLSCDQAWRLVSVCRFIFVLHCLWISLSKHTALSFSQTYQRWRMKQNYKLHPTVIVTICLVWASAPWLSYHIRSC